MLDKDSRPSSHLTSISSCTPAGCSLLDGFAPSRQECGDEVVFFGGRHGERPEGHRYSKSQVIAFRSGCHCSPESWMSFIDPDCGLDQACVPVLRPRFATRTGWQVRTGRADGYHL